MAIRSLVPTRRDIIVPSNWQFVVLITVVVTALLTVEALFVLDRPFLGRWVAVAAYLGFTLGAWFRQEWASVLGACSLLLVFRLVSLTMPTFVDLTLYWLPLVYLPFLPAALYASRAFGGVSLHIRSDRMMLVPAVTSLSTVALALVAYGYVPPLNLLPETTTAGLAVLSVVLLLVATVEELLFRELLQSTVSNRMGVPTGIVVSSLVFATMHQYTAPHAVVFAFSAGLLYAILFEWTESILPPIGAHGLMNLLLFVILPTVW